MKVNILPVLIIIIFLLIFRIVLGIQINFSHKDFEQIYLIGLENAFSGKWSYWGPDIVWSETRLPGALQGLLVGVPLRLCKHPYSPIILSNIISSIGLILLAFYAKKRFPELSLYFLLFFFLLLPFCVFQGVVLLNTTYLIFSGSILFIAVFELFIYRDNILLKDSSWYFFIIGFSLLFTYQLHLTWVMYLPFIIVLFYLEWKRTTHKWWKPIIYFAIGAFISGLTFLPTLLKYSEVILINAEGNLVFRPERIGSIIDLFIRLFTFATFDVTSTYNFCELASERSIIISILFQIMKVIAILHFISLWITFFYVRKSIEFRKTFLLFSLTLIMALFLCLLSNKHLESRTYILLYPLPVWMSLFSYNYLIRYGYVKKILNTLLILVFILFLGITVLNYNGKYSFKSVEKELKQALDNENPYEFAERRKTLMDNYQ